jgi:hypothetical protein
MSEFKSPNFRNEDGSAAPDIVGVTTFTSPYYFVPPSGTTAERPSGDGLAPGMLRFNTDIGRLEVWRNDHWATILGEQSSPLGGRGLFGAGGGFNAPTTPNTARIDYITIATTGNGIDFGDLTQARSTYQGRASSRTRGIWGGGYVGSPLTPTGSSNIIDYVEIPTLGDAVDFGNLSGSRFGVGGHSDSTRGLFGGGASPDTSTIDKITISSTGDATSFGNLSLARRIMGCCGSPTRAVWGGSVLLSNQPGATSNSTRGIIGGGNTPAGSTNIIQFITIATTGNAQDFGDLTQTKSSVAACSNAHGGL